MDPIGLSGKALHDHRGGLTFWLTFYPDPVIRALSSGEITLMKPYQVLILYRGERISLPCQTIEEARSVRQSFINWGGRGYDISIEPNIHGEVSTSQGR